MTAREHSLATAPAAASEEEQALPPLMRAAIWVAIGALIAAALVCVVWVLVGEQNGIIGRAFATVLLLASFAGVTILDVHLAPRRPSWFALASMATWIVLLLIGAVMIWMPERTWWLASRFVNFLIIVLIFQLVLLHVRLYAKALARRVTTFTQVVAIVTIVLVVTLAVLLTLPLMFSEWVYFSDLYGRVVVAVAILAAVGTALLPLVNVLFTPRIRRPTQLAYAGGDAHYGAIAAAPAPEPLPWPYYVDGKTPLPMLPDGSPDWNAYYSGQPSAGAYVFPTPAQSSLVVSESGPAAAEEAASEQPPAAHVPAAPADANASAEAAPAVTPESATAPVDDIDYRNFPPPPPLPPRP
ncbi:DUF2304 domain-containing protein [Microbacterium sp. NPDC076911]|uniref:DUF2304 domain-containing protein n=1 Tax=Microbacterium sp. NPDC076911 TaxID=3154958 RepID=UPI0034173754